MTDFDFDSLKTNEPVIVFELLDCSGSMWKFIRDMETALINHKNEILKLDEVNSIRFQRVDFCDNSVKISDFQHMSKFSTNYSTSGGTPLFKAIVQTVDNFLAKGGFYDKLIDAGKNPNIIFSIFSDGEDNEGGYSIEQAKNAVSRMNAIGTTAFIAFGGRSRDVGEKLGVQAIKSYDDNNGDGIGFAFEQISRSVTKTSKSKISLGKNFFDDV